MFFNNNFSFQISKTYSDPRRRFIIWDLITNGKILTLANIYAPNEDDPEFFNSSFNHLLDFRCEEITIRGDFNLVLDVEKDKKGGLARTHKKSLDVISIFCESLDLTDAWRVLNLDSSRFTWRRKKPEVYCRLDLFLVNQSTFCNTSEADLIIPGYYSRITLQISLHSNKRGRGFWKLNTSLLKDTEYVNRIKLIINRTKEEYTNDETVDPSLLWEMVEIKVPTRKRKWRRNKKQSIAFLEQNLAKVFTDDAVKQNMWSELETKKRELETIIEHQTKDAILRWPRPNIDGIMKVKKIQNTFLIWKRDIVSKAKYPSSRLTIKI